MSHLSPCKSKLEQFIESMQTQLNQTQIPIFFLVENTRKEAKSKKITGEDKERNQTQKKEKQEKTETKKKKKKEEGDNMQEREKKKKKEKKSGNVQEKEGKKKEKFEERSLWELSNPWVPSFSMYLQKYHWIMLLEN